MLSGELTFVQVKKIFASDIQHFSQMRDGVR
jgi:hypothetical protein